jgi:aryl-alcohol dehydrogenase-like predicted oxidoreductase
MKMRKLGTAGPAVSAIALGCMAMSGAGGPADRGESIATIHAALDAGINLLDTGDFYGNGHNELLLAEALQGGKRERALLSVKFGAMRSPGGQWGAGFDGRPAALRNFLAYSLVRLGVDYVDVYRPARLDPQVPIEETVGAIAEMVKAGYVRYIGLSEVSAATIRRANAVHPIVDVQLEYSLFTRGIEDTILPACRDLGIDVTAYGVLARGMFGGSMLQTRTSTRAALPRFTGENLEKNLALADALHLVAAAKGVSAGQIAIAWVLHRGAEIVPLVGARRREQLADVLGALNVTLDAAALAAIEAAVPKGAAMGERYNPHQMRELDSEVRA